ncbi:MAG: IS1380 family transposase [Bacteroidales bacterium]|nr:IS1380 family transposase [Bacteroidales bacterium]
MAKIEKISKNITSFAGVFFVNDEFSRSGLGKLIDNQLGIRSSSCGYTYSNLFRNFFNLFLSGGECAEDIQQYFRSTLEQIPNNKVASADTLLRCFNELATENTTIVSTSKKEYQFNINETLNDLNIKSLLLTKQLQKGKYYDFDYDNQIIEHEKYDAKKTYKKNTGYFPGVGTIADKIVYIENRDGNANVKTAQAETLERSYKLLNDNEIYVNCSRMDAGSYSKEIVEVVDKYSNFFYIRANKCETLTEEIRQITDWKIVEINYTEYQVASIPFTRFLTDRNYRLVIMGEKTNDSQLEIFEGEKFNYRCILTNDHQATEKEIIEYYNQRGSSEKIFDIQNNDFGWKHLPSSNMNANTVYLIITAMLKNFYNYLVRKVSKVFTDILPTSRLKRFIFRFIEVSGRYVYRGRQWILQLYTNRPYEMVFR